MHKLKALTTLQWLVKGKNPITKKPLPQDSVYRNPEVTMSLFIAMQALETQIAQEQQMLSASAITDPYAIDIAVLNRQMNREQPWNVAAAVEDLVVQEIDPPPVEIVPSKKKTSTPLNAGKPWNSAEDEELVRAFDEGASIKTLAEKHQRTVGSINARLMRNGRMTLSPDSQAADKLPSSVEGAEEFECPW